MGEGEEPGKSFHKESLLDERYSISLESFFSLAVLKNFYFLTGENMFVRP